MSSVSESAKCRVGIVGCGDVAHRWYLPALAGLRETVEIAACCDANPGRAERATAAVVEWSPGATPHTDLERMLAGERLDAIFNLTPAPTHGVVTRSALEAGLHVYSEKPIASSVTEADELIAIARERGRHLICAPAVAVTRRFRWLAEIVASDRFGRLTLAVAHHADPGPASWREYTGDPTVFYGPGVGPLVDHGDLPSPRADDADGSGASGAGDGVDRDPDQGRARRTAGRPHDRGDDARSHADQPRVRERRASVSCWRASAPRRPTRRGWSCTSNGPRSASRRDRSTTGTRGRASTWTTTARSASRAGRTRSSLPPPVDPRDLVEMGPAHFIAVLRGEETPVLTAEHARHVLEIMLAASASIEDGASQPISTTF